MTHTTAARGMLLLLAGCILSATARMTPVANADTDEIKIPPASRSVTLDGTIDSDEWADAACFRDMQIHHTFTPTGSGTYYPQPTAVYLKYDTEALWVATDCRETQSSYPRADADRSGQTLTLDDAIQVILATGAGDTNDAINVGGYEGATNTALPSVAHMYMFTANAAGAISRAYNEGPPLERALFEVRTGRTDNGWSLEMRIPFASAGITEPAGKVIQGNLVRFRPPGQTSWVTTGGGYRPMQYAPMLLLTEDLADSRTMQADAPEYTPTRDTPPSPPAQDTLVFHNLARQVVATIGKDAVGTRAVLNVPALKADTTVRITDASLHRVILHLDDLTPGQTCEATLDILQPNGTKVRSSNLQFTYTQPPEWYTHELADEYLHDKVPAPWTMPEIDGSMVRLAFCTIRFGDNGLPASITNKAGEMLAAPATLELSYDGKTLATEPGSLNLSRIDNAVLAEASHSTPAGTLHTRVRVEFDGFMIVKCYLEDANHRDIDKVQLRIPLRKSIAQFVNRGHSQDTLTLAGNNYSGPAGYLWTGTYDHGMTFSYDTPVFFSEDYRRQIQVHQHDNRADMVATFVDGARQVPTRDHIFRFFLHPTPTKDIPRRRLKGLISNWFEQWSDYQGYPDLKKIPEVKKLADEAHEKGQLQTVYFSHSLAENSPDFEEYRDELVTDPLRMWYRRRYNPGKGVPTYVCCTRGPFGELLLYGVNELIEQAGLNGVYMDGTSYPFSCENPAHYGCDDNGQVTWDGLLPTKIVGSRRFLTRLRGLFDARNEPCPLYSHTGGGLDIHTLSLCDFYREGEQLSRYLQGYRIPISQFLVGYTGVPWGYTGMIQYNKSFTRNTSSYSMLTWAVVHDTEVLGYVPEFTEQFLEEYRTPDSTFYPYWRQRPHLSMTAGDLPFSYYRKPDSSLVLVSNFGYDDQKVTLDVSKLYDEPVWAMDIEEGTAIPVSGGEVTIEVSNRLWRGVKITPGAQPADMPTHATGDDADVTQIESFTVRSFDPDQWSAGNTKTEVILGEQAHEETEGLPVLVKSPSNGYGDYLFDKPFGRNATIHLKLRRGNRMHIKFGDAYVHYYNSRFGVAGADPRAIDIRTFTPADSDAGSTVDFLMTIQDGVLNVSSDGKPLIIDAVLKDISHENTLMLRTWVDWFAIDVIELSTEVTDTAVPKPVVRHPVR